MPTHSSRTPPPNPGSGSGTRSRPSPPTPSTPPAAWWSAAAGSRRCLAAGQLPSAPCQETFDAGSARPAAGPDQHAPPLLPNAHPRLGSGGQRPAVPLAAEPVSRSGPGSRRGTWNWPPPWRSRNCCSPAAPRPRTTTTSFPAGMEDAIDIEVRAVRRLGMRATLTRGSMTLGEDDGGLPPQSTVQAPEVILADSERLIREYHERGRRRRDPDCPGTVLAVFRDQGDHGRKRRAGGTA